MMIDLEYVKAIRFNSGITCLRYDEATTFLFVGTFHGDIKAYQKSPRAIELELKGHTKA